MQDYTVVVACFSKTASLLVLEDCKGGQAKLEKAADFTAILNSGDDSLVSGRSASVLFAAVPI
jgi:hypothetical protein